ncbi:MAG: molybdopterin-binding protein [Pseudomonadota bacterium]
MIFEFRAPDACVGMMLGHSVSLASQRLRKGHWLTEADVEALVQAGVSDVFAGQLEDGDVLEDDAAQQIAKHAAGAHIAFEKPHTGRCNLIAKEDGVITYERDRLIALNAIDAKITLAMVPPLSTVRANDLVGTVKIIPFAVPGEALAACTELLATHGPLSTINPFLGARCALLETRLSAVKPLSEKILGFTQERAQRVGLVMDGVEACDHRPGPVADWIKAKAASIGPQGVLLIFGASATVDEADVIPAAIQRAGGTVERVGMAADPGNLLVFGKVGQATVIGLPGCAKSPALNGFDWVLERVAANIAITPQDWAEMSVGGLLKEIEARPQLRRPVPKA